MRMEPLHMGFGGTIFSGMGSFMLILMLWTLLWEGLALWHAARRKEYGWFIGLLILNTFGILEIIYLFVFAKIKPDALFTLDGSKDKTPADSH